MQKSSLQIVRNIFIFAILMLSALVVATPLLVDDGAISMLKDDQAESVTLAVVLLSGLFLYYAYKKELQRQQQQLSEALHHIGKINVQIQHIKKSFQDVTKFPESKSDFKYILKSGADNILAIVNCDWVYFRIIEVNKVRTLTEHIQAREARSNCSCMISNKDLINNNVPENYCVITTIPQNIELKAFCVLPVNDLSSDQKDLIGRVVNDLGMLYIIFTSRYYRNSREQRVKQ